MASTAVRPRSEDLRELALAEVRGRPAVPQAALAERLHELTGLAPSTAVKVLRMLEREGALASVRQGRCKVYRLPDAPAPVDLLRPPARPELPARAGEAAGSARGRAAGRRELAIVVGAVLAIAAVVGFLLAPDKHELISGDSKPAAPVSPARPAPATRASTTTRSSAVLGAAKRLDTAVLSGVDVPGIAARTGSRLARRGFHVGAVANAPGPIERTVVLYAAGKRAQARALARAIGGGAVAPADPTTQSIAPGASLIVVLGADRRS